MKLAWLALFAACTFDPKAQLLSDGSPSDSGLADATSDGPVADAPHNDPPGLVCPSGYVQLGQLPSRYKIYGYTPGNRGSSFANAQQTCSGPHTHLAIAGSADEVKALWAAIAVNPKSPYFWEGITDAANEAVWRTVLGAPPAYMPWGAGQPSGGAAADCALANRDNVYDWFCGSRYPFACECE